MILAVVLVVHLVLYPNLPEIVIGRYETEFDCEHAARELKKAMPLKVEAECRPNL